MTVSLLCKDMPQCDHVIVHFLSIVFALYKPVLDFFFDELWRRGWKRKARARLCITVCERKSKTSNVFLAHFHIISSSVVDYVSFLKYHNSAALGFVSYPRIGIFTINIFNSIKYMCDIQYNIQHLLFSKEQWFVFQLLLQLTASLLYTFSFSVSFTVFLICRTTVIKCFNLSYLNIINPVYY